MHIGHNIDVLIHNQIVEYRRNGHQTLASDGNAYCGRLPSTRLPLLTQNTDIQEPLLAAAVAGQTGRRSVLVARQLVQISGEVVERQAPHMPAKSAQGAPARVRVDHVAFFRSAVNLQPNT